MFGARRISGQRQHRGDQRRRNKWQAREGDLYFDHGLLPRLTHCPQNGVNFG